MRTKEIVVFVRPNRPVIKVIEGVTYGEARPGNGEGLGHLPPTQTAKLMFKMISNDFLAT